MRWKSGESGVIGLGGVIGAGREVDVAVLSAELDACVDLDRGCVATWLDRFAVLLEGAITLCSAIREGQDRIGLPRVGFKELLRLSGAVRQIVQTN